MNTEIIVTLNREGTLHDLDPFVEAIADAVRHFGYANDPDLNNDETKIISIISLREMFLETDEDVDEWVGLLAETSDIIVMPLTSEITDEEESEDE